MSSTNNLNTNINTIKITHDDSIFIINNELSTKPSYKRKRSTIIVSHGSEGEDILLALTKSAKLLPEDEKSIGSTSEGTKGSEIDIYYNDITQSYGNYHHIVKSPSPIDHTYFPGRGALVKPTVLRSTSDRNFVRGMKKTRSSARQPLIRPRNVLMPAGCSHSSNFSVKSETQIFELAHFDHSQKNRNSNDINAQNKNELNDSERDLSMLDAAFLLSSHFVRSDCISED